MAKVVLELEIDTQDVGFALNSLGNIEEKVGEWCEEQEFVKSYRVKRYQKGEVRKCKRIK